MKRVLVFVLLCALLLLSGCSEKKETETGETFSDPSETSGESSADLSVTGQAVPVFIEGEETREKAFSPPERVVCMSRPLAEIVFELGFGDRIKARGSYCTYPSELSALPDAGRPTAIDTDALAAISPDLLLTATAVSAMDKAKVEAIGAKVEYIPAPKSFEELGEVYAQVSRVFSGDEEAGRAAFSELSESLEGSGLRIGRFVYITEGACAAGDSTIEGSVLSLFGENAAAGAEGYTGDLGFLDTAAPDIVILSDEELRESLTLPEGARTVYIDSSYFESPSGRLRELVDILA